MTNKGEAILFVFSKDRPTSLEATLDSLISSRKRIIVIDDSAAPQNRAMIEAHCRDIHVDYHGRIQQEGLLSAISKPLGDKIRSFTATLGLRKWSLGFNRNYALICARRARARMALFVDDDITLKDSVHVDRVFSELENSRFVGAAIDVMPDYSLLGHVYSAGGACLPGYVSGGFLGINLENLEHYFLNVYNEDWIWLFLEAKGSKPAIIGSVSQRVFNPFNHWKRRALFQEYGEILWKGVLNSSDSDRLRTLMTPRFWKEAIMIRQREIRLVEDLTFCDRFERTAHEVRDYLLEIHKKLEPAQFAREFAMYDRGLNTWKSLLTEW